MLTISNAIFYVYAHRKKTNNEIFYIGKGKWNRAFSNSNRNKYWHNVVSKYGFKVEMLRDNLHEQESFDLEIYAIKHYRNLGLKLANMTDGGEGVSGYIFREESKIKMSLAKKGKVSPRKGAKLPEQQKINHANFMKGKMVLFDSKAYHFANKLGNHFVGMRHELHRLFNVPLGNIHIIIHENRCLNGWALNGYDFSINLKSISKIGTNNGMYGILGHNNHRTNNKILSIIKDNEVFTGTWYDFAENFNINRKLASEFFAGRKNSCYGWRLSTS